MNDTPPEIEKMMHDRLMARSPHERLMMASGMFDMARRIVLASFPPGLSEIEIKRRLCERFYGDEVDVEGFVAYLLKLEEKKRKSDAAFAPEHFTTQE